MTARRPAGTDTLKSRLRAALAAQKAGDGPRARALYESVLKAHPQQADALHLLGVLLMEQGETAAGLAHLARAVAVRPRSALVRCNYGQALLAAGRPAEAVDQLTRAAAAAPDDADLLAALAQAHLANRNPEKAEAHFRRVLTMRPGHAAALTGLGDALYRAGRAGEAAECFRSAIGAAPDHAPAYNNLGTALEALGDLERAAAAYEAALKRAPGHIGATLNLGVVRLRTGQPDRAETAFDTVLAHDPANRRALAYRAIARQERGALLPDTARDELARQLHMETPPSPAGYDDLEHFLRMLSAELLAHPARRRDVAGTATTGGFDALRLLDHKGPALAAFERLLRIAIDRRLKSIAPEPGHPFLGRVPRDYDLDVWATFLPAGGYQFPHIHPSGWMSGVYYVQVPPAIGDQDTDGWIEFNRPDESFDYTFTPSVILKRPAPGLMILFPSYAYHRTLPFRGAAERISIAFDVKPKD